MSWTQAKLRDVATIERDGIASDAITAGTNYLGLEHIESGGKILGAVTVDAGDLASTKFRFTKHHVLYGKLRPYLAKIATPDFDGICSTDIVPIMPGPKLDRSFLTHFLRQPVMIEFASSRTTGANLPRLSPKALADFEIPLPPLDEQKRIAAILDQADELRRKRQRAIDRLNQLGQAIFCEMFGAFHNDFGGWPLQRLETLVDDAQIGAVRGAKEMGDDRPVEYLRMDSIGIDGSLRLEGLRRVEASNSDLAKYHLRQGDLLFNTRNSKELVGKTAVVRSEFDGIYNNNILRVRFDERMTGDFLDAFLRTRKGTSILSAIKSGTTSVFAIYQKSLLSLEVPVPPMDLQRRYADRLKELFLVQKQQVDAAAWSTNLFSSLQDSAFQGEL